MIALARAAFLRWSCCCCISKVRARFSSSSLRRCSCCKSISCFSCCNLMLASALNFSNGGWNRTADVDASPFVPLPVFEVAARLSSMISINRSCSSASASSAASSAMVRLRPLGDGGASSCHGSLKTSSIPCASSRLCNGSRNRGGAVEFTTRASNSIRSLESIFILSFLFGFPRSSEAVVGSMAPIGVPGGIAEVGGRPPPYACDCLRLIALGSGNIDSMVKSICLDSAVGRRAT